ncbi:MAG: hypothetical protein H7A10_04900 [Oceanospirillaceae bacterium]|nr:hypothetical protein [Oceanospirillaceae bacterium]
MDRILINLEGSPWGRRSEGDVKVCYALMAKMTRSMTHTTGGWSKRTNPETLQSYYERTALDPRTQQRRSMRINIARISICVGIGTGGFWCFIPAWKKGLDSKNQRKNSGLEEAQKQPSRTAKQLEAEQHKPETQLNAPAENP